MCRLVRCFLYAAIAAVILPNADAHADRNRHSHSSFHRSERLPYRFGTLNILPDEVALLHVDAYAPADGKASDSCQIHIAFVSEEVVLAEDTFTISPNRTVDNAFPGPSTGVIEMHPVISADSTCNLDIVPVLQVQEKVAAGTGKTLYIYPGQFSVPLGNQGDVGSLPE